MPEVEGAKKRRGRPPKSAEDRKGGNLTFRVRDGMREWLEASAKARGLSISEEIEKRLEQSRHQAAEPFMDTALRMAAANCMVVQELTGQTIASDPYTRAACAKAAATAIELVGGIVGQDAPETRALLQTDAEVFGQVVGMFTKATLDGVKGEAIAGLHQLVEIMVDRRQVEIAEQGRRQRNLLLAKILRGEVVVPPATPENPAEAAPALNSAPGLFRSATPEEIARDFETVRDPKRPPELFDGSDFADIGLEEVADPDQGAEPPAPPPAPAPAPRRRARAKA